MYKHSTVIVFFVVVIGFFNSLTLVGQTFIKPKLMFGTSACDQTNTKNNWGVEVFFTGSAFANDNTFTLQLSDANGSFASPTEFTFQDVALNTSTTPFTLTFQLPDGTFGTGYKVKVLADKPQRESPESDAFSAYDMIGESNPLQLVVANATICNNETFTIEIAGVNGETAVFDWYKDDALTPFTNTTEPKLTVTETGRYQAKIDYGTCGFRETIYAIVNGLTSNDAQIVDSTGGTIGSPLEICATDSATFYAKTQNTALFNYQWYKDGNPISGATGVSYTTPNTGQFGMYKLQMKAKTGSCTVESNQEVELKQQTDPGFTITTIGAGKGVILPCETIVLKIEGQPSTATIEWFKDNVSLNKTNPEINASTAGVYFARVTVAGSGSCDAVVDSEVYELFNVTGFKSQIRVEGYEECVSSTAVLKTVGIDAIGTDGQQYSISQDRFDKLSYRWFKNGVVVPSASTFEYTVGSYLNNGEYQLEVGTCTPSQQTLSDNKISIQLIAKPTITSVPNSNSLCAGSKITYTIDNLISGYTYQWFKDGGATPIAADVKDFEVTEVGTYTLIITGYGCNNVLVETINVVPFDDSAIQVTPSEKVVLVIGNSVTVTASGAESYIWYEGEDDQGTVLSTNETFNATALGFYTVAATVGSCVVLKTIEVVEQDDQVIVPNTVTPNGDGVNDTWLLSNKYAYQPNVNIIIYNANGKELMNVTDYKNDWPLESVGNQRTFYYKIIRDNKILKAGTISVLR